MHVFFIILAIIFTSLGQILQKKATVSAPFIRLFKKYRFGSIFTCNFIFATASMSLATVFWVLALAKLDLSIANPSLSLSYVLVMLYSKYVFGDEIPKRRWLGVLLIIIGIIVISNS